MTTIVGIDPSLTATGVATLTIAGQRHVLHTTRINTDPAKGITGRAHRLRTIHAQVATHATGADLVVIEGPALNMSNPGTWDRAGLWWMIAAGLATHGTPVAVCPPSTLKKYATGSGRATKSDMRMALFTRAGEDLADDNEVDAAWLAIAGAAHHGHDLYGMPAHNRTALDKIEWPVEELAA